MPLRRLFIVNFAGLLVGALVLAGIGSVTTYLILRLKRAAVTEALEVSAIHARAFEDHMTRSLGTVEHLAGLLSASPVGLASGRLDDFFRQTLRHAPMLRSLSLLDEKGSILASSNPDNVGLTFSDNDFLPPLSASAILSLRIGRPWAGRDVGEGMPLEPLAGQAGDGPGFIPVLFPMELDGRRAVLLAALNPDFFITYFIQRLEPRDGFVEVLRYDQTVLLTTGDRARQESQQIRDRIRELLPETEAGRLEQPLEGSAATLVAFRATRHSPILVVTHLYRDRALASWRSESRRLLGLVIPALVGLTLLSVALYRRQQRLTLLRAEMQGRERERLAATVFDTVSEAVMVSGPDHRIMAVNPAFTRITGYLAEEVVGRDPVLLYSEDCGACALLEQRQTLASRGHWEGEVRNRRKDGALFVVWQSINVVRGEDGLVTHHVCGLTDITAYRTEADRVAWQAQHDLLTGLPNRTLLTDRLCQAIRQARRNRTRLAIIFVDLDKFKPVNDTLGHAVGDQLLQAVAERLLGCLRDSDSVARQGGDEFVVLIPGVEDVGSVLQVAEKIRLCLCQPFQLSAHTISIGSSSGVAIFPDHGGDESQLLHCADNAMYRAKAAGGDRVALCASCVMPIGTPASLPS
ncbi:MAG: hypothetical protein BWK76_14360 [Desulfobulbaceae bacterium A2]|nr:MAG: hypothetical protein BWK76_14360 [Desulfobulbaceae bacterium A2]